MSIRRNPPRSVKQVLVRDFNWRMGNLRRLYHSLGALDEDLADKVRDLIQQQTTRETARHNKRLEIERLKVESSDMVNPCAEVLDDIHRRAIWAVAHNKDS